MKNSFRDSVKQIYEICSPQNITALGPGLEPKWPVP